MFGLSRADGTAEDALLIAPALGASLQGRDIEDVLLLRDEVANLAWAVERAVEGDDGLPADRAQAANEAAPATPPPAARPTPSPTACAPTRRQHWFPLLPQRARRDRPVDDLPPRRAPARHAVPARRSSPAAAC